MFLKHLRAIIKKELIGYFGSPVAYVFIVIFLLLSGFFTFSVSRFYEMGQADLTAFFEWLPLMFLFLVPAVAMRLWAEERRIGTLELLLTQPVTMAELILGKFLAAWFFICFALALTFPLVITVAYLGDPDFGPIFCGYLGGALLAAALLSVGSMTSSLTKNQVISFILSIVICLFFTLAGWPPVTGALSAWAPTWLVDLVAGFSFVTHFQDLQRGIIDLRDLVYFASVVFFMLFTTAVVLENRRSL